MDLEGFVNAGRAAQDAVDSLTAFPEKITIREKYGPAMAITDQSAADAYFGRCVAHSMRFGGLTRPEAERVERINLGYYAGYYDAQTQERVNRLFLTTHPVFGDRRPSPEDAFEMGRRAGEAMR